MYSRRFSKEDRDSIDKDCLGWSDNAFYSFHKTAMDAEWFKKLFNLQGKEKNYRLKLSS